MRLTVSFIGKVMLLIKRKTGGVTTHCLHTNDSKTGIFQEGHYDLFSDIVNISLHRPDNNDVS